MTEFYRAIRARKNKFNETDNFLVNFVEKEQGLHVLKLFRITFYNYHFGDFYNGEDFYIFLEGDSHYTTMFSFFARWR